MHAYPLHHIGYIAQDAEELLAALDGAASRKLHAVASGGHFGLFDTPLTPNGTVEEDLPAEVRLAAAATAAFVRAALLGSSMHEVPLNSSLEV